MKLSKEAIAAKEQKQMYYFSMEFLMGRLMTNNLMNLGIYDIVKDGLADLDIDINELEDLESDAGLKRRFRSFGCLLLRFFGKLESAGTR